MILEKGLKKSNWEYYGDWSIEEENKKPILVITNSLLGGITTKGHTWVDYEFEFETKIIERCTAWIIRAQDIQNLLYFQWGLEKNEIVPHFRSGGLDFVLGSRKISSINAQKNQWFKIKTKIIGSKIQISINNIIQIDEDFNFIYSSIKTEKGEENIRFNIYPMGRIGFRLWGPERAAFRNIKVNPI